MSNKISEIEDDPIWIWDDSQSSKETESREAPITNGDINAYENANGSYKSEVISESNWCESKDIIQLNNCTSVDSFKEVARLLGQIFKFWPSHEGHWQYIVQNYTLRVIKWVLSATIKQYLRGGIRKTPAHFFTYKILLRTKRKIPKKERELIATIGGRKSIDGGDNE